MELSFYLTSITAYQLTYHINAAQTTAYTQGKIVAEYQIKGGSKLVSSIY
jgi:hypothetical protein